MFQASWTYGSEEEAMQRYMAEGNYNSKFGRDLVDFD
jgi:hypothetical protein